MVRALFYTQIVLLLFFLFLGIIILRFISPILSQKLVKIQCKEKFENLSPLRIFLILFIFLRLSLISVPCSVGEDIAQQVLTSQQWVEGASIAPNFISYPDSTNLSANFSSWFVRPLGAAWIPLPFLILGFSLGNSIHISLFILSTAFGIGWLRLANSFSLSNSSLQLLAILLSIIAALGSLSLSTASVFTAATFPWLLAWSLQLGDQWSIPKNKFKIHLLSFLFFLSIGAHALFKLSSLLTVSAIALIPFLIYYTKFRKINYTISVRVVIGITLFFLPYFLLSELNSYLSGISSHELYSKQDYNAQHELWGKYFTESTRGGMLVTSIMAATGYSSPVQSLSHNFRDLLLQFENYPSLLHHYQINPRVVGCCILAIPFTFIIFTAILKLKGSLKKSENIIYCTLFTVPFIGFALVSYIHGYNYLIYPAYTKEFSVIFLIFALNYSILHKGKINKLIGNVLMLFFIVFPLRSYGKNYCSTIGLEF